MDSAPLKAVQTTDHAPVPVLMTLFTSYPCFFGCTQQAQSQSYFACLFVYHDSLFDRLDGSFVTSVVKSKGVLHACTPLNNFQHHSIRSVSRMQ